MDSCAPEELLACVIARLLDGARHAAVQTFVTYEELRKGDMLEDELLAPGVVSSIYVTATAPAPRGAWPLGVADLYGIDDAHLAHYAKAAKTQTGFQNYLNDFVFKSATV